MTNLSGNGPSTLGGVGSHGDVLRGLGATSSSSREEGRFGRMFRHVPVYEHDPNNLFLIAEAMISEEDEKEGEPVPDPPPVDDDENPNLPAGYTYLGQFIDHDITFDPVSSLQRQNDPDSLYDFRTPRLDLDNLYGRGPDDQPYLYAQTDTSEQDGFNGQGVLLLLGRDVAGDKSNPFNGPDLQRNSDGRALIGDPRNDENLIISQLQSLFVRFHNAMAKRVHSIKGLEGVSLLKETQRQVRWCYQWIVVNDFLRRVLDGDPGDLSTKGTGVVDDILRTEIYSGGGTAPSSGTVYRPRLLFYHPRRQSFMPVEFSVAAYRFGHSMVRPSYFINDQVKADKINARVPIFSASADATANLNGFRPLVDHWGVQWKYFYDLDPSFAAQRSYKIDTHLSHPLGALPGVTGVSSLAQRNLDRGIHLSLPSGQNVARAMGMEPLGSDQIGLGDVAPEYADDTPLWFYVLKEAEVLGGSERLGSVGGRIVAEVIIGLLANDPYSYVNAQPRWQPDADLTEAGRFGMPELIRFADPTAMLPPAPTPYQPE